MAEKTKNLCAQIPETLHGTVRTHQLASGKNMNDYMTELLTDYYENQKGMKTMENTRTLAVQLDAELFDEFDAYLKKNNFKKRPFITDLIRKVLEEAKQAEASEGDAAPTDVAE